MQPTANSPTDADKVPVKSPTGVVGAAAIRGRMRRGKGDIDGRSSTAKQIQRIVQRFTAALGEANSVRMVQVRRAAELLVTCERLRASALQGDPVDLEALCKIENICSRSIATLGLDRKRESAGETLADIMREAGDG